MVMRLLKHGSKIGNATVIVDIIPAGNPEIRPGRKMVPRFLTDHDTGNAGRDADAEMHNRYIHNMASYHPRDTTHVSWHLTVDEKYIYQHIPFDEIAWHCGDGTGSGNYSSVGVEKCMHVNGDRNKIEANGIVLHAYLMKALSIPIHNVKPHQAWSGKYCPALILKKYGSFLPFRNKIEAAFKGGSIAQPASTEESIVDYLKSKGQDASFTARTKLATAYGIPNYRGTAVQNEQLLALLKADKPSTVKPTAPVSKPAPIIKEEIELDKELIVIHSEKDYIAAQKLSIRNNIKVIERRAVKGKMAETAYIIGGSKKGIEGVADKFIDLSGPTWGDTVAKVEAYLKK